MKRRVPRTEGWDVVPDLAVEVISESNTANAVAIKIEEYFQAGVRVVWVVLPVTKKVYVYESPTQVRILQVGDMLEGGDLLPGFQVRAIDPVRGGRRGARAGELIARSEVPPSGGRS